VTASFRDRAHAQLRPKTALQNMFTTSSIAARRPTAAGLTPGNPFGAGRTDTSGEHRDTISFVFGVFQIFPPPGRRGCARLLDESAKGLQESRGAATLRTSSSS